MQGHGLCFVHGGECGLPDLSQRSVKWVHLIQRLCRYYAVSIYRYYSATGLAGVRTGDICVSGAAVADCLKH
jgi:hypothetical protein